MATHIASVIRPLTLRRSHWRAHLLDGKLFVGLDLDLSGLFHCFLLDEGDL